MRKIIWKIFFFAILFINLFTNNSYSQLKNFGLKGGLNLSNADLKSDFLLEKGYHADNKTGFNIYLLYDFLNYKNVILSGEAGYSQKGFDEEVVVVDEFGNYLGTDTQHSLLNYIDINILAGFILRNKSVSPYISFGPVLSIYTGYNEGSSVYPDNEFSENTLLENLKSPVLGLITGAGIEIDKVIPQTLLFEVRYNFDLTNSFNNGFLNYKRNYLWQFNAGIKF